MLDYASIICAGKTFVLHLQAIIEEVTLKALICLVDKKTGEKSKTRPRFIKQDQIAIVRFQSDDVICMETFKDHPQLGRFTLRDEGTAITHTLGRIIDWVKSFKGCHISCRQSHVLLCSYFFFLYVVVEFVELTWHIRHDPKCENRWNFFSTRFFAMNFMRY